MINKKRMILIISSIAICAILFNIITRSVSPGIDEYISPSADKITYDDVKESFKKIDFSKIKEGEFPTDKIVNRHTVRFFKYLQLMFKDKNYEDHLAAIKEYLLTLMNPADAEKMFQLYKKFVDYENEVAALISSSGGMKSEEDYLTLLQKVKSLQVKYFGQDDAVIMFGAEMKAQEYPVRRNAIVNNKNLYGKDKEERIAKLNEDMWGSQASEFEDSRKPYVKYQDKLNIYNKDLSEMPESERAAKIKEFREDIFPPDVVERLEEVDKQLALENQRDSSYQAEYSRIVSDNSLSDSEKQARISELQNSTYGDQADAVRRAEEMKKRKKEMLSKYQ